MSTGMSTSANPPVAPQSSSQPGGGAAADGAATATGITVFATHPGWEALDDGQRVSAVVTVASTASPARLLARATSPPVTDAHAGPEPGPVEAVRADLTRIAGHELAALIARAEDVDHLQRGRHGHPLADLQARVGPGATPGVGDAAHGRGLDRV